MSNRMLNVAIQLFGVTEKEKATEMSAIVNNSVNGIDIQRGMLGLHMPQLKVRKCNNAKRHKRRK